ncbi:hypothetical protein BDN70DRAFT_538166 [Pholiota conissans]|uniref:Uncharacterized protein n=1 Tax=Pholiota conissans TaxID=109636 RepID=A0A9P5ZCG5_9AGAR|nr:hypothetical protein BDN70DRAFT_538166 [Pholiota conissans]
MFPIHDDNQPHQTHSRAEDKRDHDVSAAAISVAQTETDVIYTGPGNKIYEKHFRPLQRGFPLWIPGPDRCLPLAYRRNGVSIGDVGTITPGGAFSFMFNIFLPAAHPINPPELPVGFEPLDLPHGGTVDTFQYSEFGPGTFLASPTVEKVRSSDPLFRGMTFKTYSAEGAILTFPDGAVTHNALNILSIRTYTQAYLASWYRFANGLHGRKLKNGGLHVVTGCDKATSWGMAAISNFDAERHSLKYYRSPDNRDSKLGNAHASIPLYEWECTGHTEAKVGPDLQEIEELRHAAEEAGIDVGGRQGKFYNQCLFLRTLNPALSEDEYKAIEREIAIESEAHDHQRRARPKLRAADGSGTGTQEAGSGQQSESNSGKDSADLLAPKIESRSSESQLLALGNVTWLENPWMPNSRRAHPADHLNKHLLELYPHCNAVITHDNDWCAVVSDSDKIMPSPEEITRRVLATHDVVERDGLVYLELKRKIET